MRSRQFAFVEVFNLAERDAATSAATVHRLTRAAHYSPFVIPSASEGPLVAAHKGPRLLDDRVRYRNDDDMSIVI